MAELEERKRPRSPYDGSEYISAREVAALVQIIEDKLDNHFDYHTFTEAELAKSSVARRWFITTIVALGTLLTGGLSTYYHFNPHH